MDADELFSESKLLYRRQNARTDGRFVRVAKMLKHWRNQALPKSARPPSIALEVMIAQAWPILLSNSDADAVSGVLRQLSNSLMFSFSAPWIMNPSLQNENLLRDFDHDHLQAFKARLDEAASIAEAARRELDEDRSIGFVAEAVQGKIPAAGEWIEIQCRLLIGPSSPEHSTTRADTSRGACSARA